MKKENISILMVLVNHVPNTVLLVTMPMKTTPILKLQDVFVESPTVHLVPLLILVILVKTDISLTKPLELVMLVLLVVLSVPQPLLVLLVMITNSTPVTEPVLPL